MSKAQELAILDRAIADLTPNSYLGPYLASVRADVEMSIRSDIMPTPELPSEMLARGRAMLGVANDEAQIIRATAANDAKALHEQAWKELTDRRELAAQALARLAAGIRNGTHYPL